MNNKRESGAAGGRALGMLKASMLAAVLTLALVLIYAFVLQQGWLDEGSIPIVTAVIKILGAAFAAFICVRRSQSKRWLMGGCAGGVYTMLAFAVFSIAAQSFNFSLAMLSDILMGVLAGMVTGMLLQLKK